MTIILNCDIVINTYDKAGNIETITENGKVIARYEYDGLNRLTKEKTEHFGEKTYEYDNAGNIIRKTENGKTYEYSYGQHGWRDQLLSFGETKSDIKEECTYDELGNPLSYKGRNLVWQGRRLISYGIENKKATYTYDFNNVRTSKTATDGTTSITSKYIYDGNNLIAEQRTVKGPDKDKSVWIYYIYGVDGIAGFNFEDKVYLYRKNVQGDITHIYRKDGNKDLVEVAHYAYDAWGNTEILSETDKIGSLNLFRYRGYYFDIETKLYYLISRYYDPETCRFISADGIEYLDPETLGGLNLYAYCCNNPVMMVDEDGTMPKWLKWLIAGVVTVALVAGAVALTIVSGGIASPTLHVLASLGASILTGAATSATMSLSQSIASGDIDLRTFGIDTGIGAISGAIAFGADKMLSIVGKATGLYLNEMMIGGVRVGDVFGNVLPSLFNNFFKVAGGVLAGMFIDKNLESVFKRNQGSLSDRFLSNIQGGIFSNILDFIKNLW